MQRSRAHKRRVPAHGKKKRTEPTYMQARCAIRNAKAKRITTPLIGRGLLVLVTQSLADLVALVLRDLLAALLLDRTHVRLPLCVVG